MLAGLAALGATMEGGGHTWSALYVETALAAGPAAGGFAAAAITLGLTAGRLLAHRIEARLGDMAVIRLFALAALPGFLILGVAPVPLVAILGFFLAGVGIGPVEPAVFRSVAGRHAETVRGVALARATGLAYLGYLLSPSIVGQAIERAGWPFAWALLGMLAIGIAALTARVPPRKV
jgi:MFS family permease